MFIELFFNVRLIIIFFLFLSCNKENCDLNYFPSPPYGNPDDTIYSGNSVRYLYVCYSSNYNKVITYEIVGECWEMYTDDEYNLNCN